jgi:uncharacterized phage protein gp47/JayE
MVADARDLMQKAFDFMAQEFPGWEPSEGQLDTAMIEGICSEAADIATLTTEVPKSIFRYYGSQIVGIIPEDAVAATATTTWVMTDNLGHIIPDGTQVTLLDPSGNVVPFVTVGDVQIPVGSTSTPTGGITIVAVVAGADSTDIGSAGGTVALLDILPFVASITQATVTTGGQDAELDDDYLNRLTLALTTISPRPILPRDFSALAINVVGVQRATTLDGYNTADSSSGNERMVTVVSIDSNGVAVDATVRAAVQSYLDSLREINFIVNVADPTVTTVDVTTNVLLSEGYATNDVQYRVQLAIDNFLDPAMWGVDPSDDPNDPTSWNNTTSVKYLELAAAISAVAGVALVVSLTIGLSGGAQTAADHALTGVAPLPKAGAIVVNYTLAS